MILRRVRVISTDAKYLRITAPPQQRKRGTRTRDGGEGG
jgi:hypothetical protein